MLGTALAVHRNRVGPGEARAFGAVNGLPDALDIAGGAALGLTVDGAVSLIVSAARRARC